MKEPKPCPLCGANLAQVCSEFWRHETVATVTEGCWLEGARVRPSEVDLWNRRPAPTLAEALLCPDLTVLLGWVECGLSDRDAAKLRAVINKFQATTATEERHEP